LRGDLLKLLESNSLDLAEISIQFVERAKRMKIISIYEGKAMVIGTPIVSPSNIQNIPSPTDT
jgi:hypothetical protein